MKPQFQRELEKFLSQFDVPWEIVTGSRHRKVYVAGKMIGVISSGNRQGCLRSTSNLHANIRRHIKEYLNGSLTMSS